MVATSGVQDFIHPDRYLWAKPLPLVVDLAGKARAGLKTQSRRPMKEQPPEWAPHVNHLQTMTMGWKWVPGYLWQWSELEQTPPRKLRRWPVDERGDEYGLSCPWGRAGSLLWVRERARVLSLERRDGVRGGRLRYEADGQEVEWVPLPDRLRVAAGRCIANGVHREGARTWLEVTDVRVERVGEISEADVLAEGFDSREAFFSVIHSIYGPAVEALWFWALTFKRIPAP